MSEFSELPNSLQEALREQQDHQRMHISDSIHSMRRFINSLDVEQLRELDSLLGSVLSNDSTNWYIRGLLTSRLDHHFEICPCQESHNLDEIVKDMDLQAVKAEPAASDLDLRYTANEMPWYDGDQFNIDTFLLKCEEYGVKPDSPWDREGDYKVICQNCGLEYVSLQDRMLRKPKIDGCHGCQLKSGHG